MWAQTFRELFEKLIHTRIVPLTGKGAEVFTHQLLSLFNVVIFLHFCPAQCWEEEALKVRGCTQARETDSPPHVLELQSRRPKGYEPYRLHLLQCVNPKTENHCLDWKIGRQSIFILSFLSLLPLCNLSVLYFDFSTRRVEEGLISKLVTP